MMNFLLLTFLLFAVCVNATPVTRTEVRSISRRSEEFHAYLARQQGQSPCPPNTWYDNRAACASVNYTQYDTLGRRNSGLLAVPQDQGSCGSCWAFASIGTFTDNRNIAANQTTSNLSPQYMTTCANDSRYVGDGNGCCGAVIAYGPCILKDVGAVTAECLPYTLGDYARGFRGRIRRLYKDLNPLTCPSTCTSGVPYDPGLFHLEDYIVRDNPTEDQIIAALEKGPVLATMASTPAFEAMYNKGCGVFCSSELETANHAVEIVDYGVTNTEVKFYVVKNSYGTTWGENGYFRVRRGDLGVGILPIVELVLSTSGASGSLPTNLTNNCNFAEQPMFTCGIASVDDPANDELILMVANFAIEELNRLSVIRCPGNVTVAGPISLSSITGATMQNVDGTVYNVTMQAAVSGCGNTINAKISAEVYQEVDGDFSLTAYTYSSGGIGMKASIILLLGAVILALLLTNN